MRSVFQVANFFGESGKTVLFCDSAGRFGVKCCSFLRQRPGLLFFTIVAMLLYFATVAMPNV